MVITEQKPMIDIQKTKGRESKHSTTEKSSNYKGGQQEKKKLLDNLKTMNKIVIVGS